VSPRGALPFLPPQPAVPRSGRLLVAEPGLRDPNFVDAVVLLLNHGEDGSLGLVLNRALQARVGDVLPPWASHVSAPDHLFQGGPVATNSAIGVAVLPGDGPEPLGVRRVVGALAVIDLDAPPEVVRSAVAGIRVFAGHAGWAAGQLEAELAAGAWFVVDAEASDVIHPDAHALRRRVLRRQRSTLAWLSTMPSDPRRVIEN